MALLHVLSAQQFLNDQDLERLLNLSMEMEQDIKKGKAKPVLAGKILGTLFYEPSTRTRFSFESAMLRLGGNVISSESAGSFSSAVKGESIEDTIRVMNAYCDAIVIRHPENGTAQRAANVSTIPIINAGDGAGEHPTQALLDTYTIWREKKNLDGLEIAFVGDLKFGRTVHSLLQILMLQKDVKMHFISPKELSLPAQYVHLLHQKNIAFTQKNNIQEIPAGADVIYMTRVQKERFATPEGYLKVKDSCILTNEIMQKMGSETIIMHPLPRVNEIATEIDADPRAAYFRQAENGLYVRMALLQLLFEKKSLEQEPLQHK